MQGAVPSMQCHVHEVALHYGFWHFISRAATQNAVVVRSERAATRLR